MKSETSNIWERILECEKKTLDKIARCEDMLEKKADKVYVDSEIENIKEHLKRYEDY